MSNSIERFDDKLVSTLNISGFENLTLDQKHLVYHLTMAGHAGRDLFYLQCCKYNLIVRRTLEKLYNSLKDPLSKENESFVLYFKVFLANNGLYDDNHNTRLEVPFDFAFFDKLANSTDLTDEEYQITYKCLFDKEFIKPYRTFKTGEGDILSVSEVNIYENLTKDEVNQYRADKYPSGRYEPNHAINKRLVKTINLNDGEFTIDEQVMRIGGLYGKQIENISNHLAEAWKYAENDNQKDSIAYLLEFYKTGDPKFFDEHCKAWISDTESSVMFINGFIETYNDPLGTAAFFESLVAFKDPKETKRINSIIENIQWFEDNLPCSDKFKKKEASAMSGSSVTVAGFSGQMNPQLPRGVILPNSEWMREELGAKSLILENVIHSQENSSKGLTEEFYLPEYQDILSKYSAASTLEMINLHEMVGHALGQLNKDVKNSDLKEFQNVLEESRADVIAMYFIPDNKLVDIGLLPQDTNMEEFAIAAYVNYFTIGAFLQLRRLPDSTEKLSQDHMRNRQLLSNWVLDMAKECNSVEIIFENNKRFVKINDVNGVRKLFAKATDEIQRIKSEGDYQAAKELSFKYGTEIDKEAMKEIKARIESLDIPAWTCFLSPQFTPVIKDEKVIDYQVSVAKSFIDDQLYLSSLF